LQAPLRRAAAAARWRLSLLVRSSRFVPPLLAELVVILVLFATRPQAAGSAVSVSAVAVFAVGLWCSLSASTVATRCGGEVTVTNAGLGAILAGEVASDAVVVGVAAVLVVAGAATVVEPSMGVAAWLVGLVAVASAGVAGNALGELLSSFRLRGAARFVLAIGLVSVTLARPAMADGRPVWHVVAVLVPPVLSFAKTLDEGFPATVGGALLVSVGCLAWAAVAVAAAALVRSRRFDASPDD
jgi:hypothetical protein